MEPFSLTVDVECIMQEIRSDIRARGLAVDELFFNPSFIHQDMGSIRSTVELLQNLSPVSAVRPIETRAGALGGVSRFFKRVVRRCVGFLLNPMAQEVTVYHQAASKCITVMYSNLVAADRRIQALEQQLGQKTQDPDEAGGWNG